MIENVPESAPLDALDDLGRSVLAIEARSPGVSSAGILKELNLKIDRRTVDHRRRHPAYQTALSEMRRDNLMEVKSAQSRAIQRLTELLEHPEPSISLAAARILAEPTLRGATKRAEAQAEEGRTGKADDNVVRVVFGDEGGLPPIPGETMMTEDGQIIPIARPEVLLGHENETGLDQCDSNDDSDENGVIQDGMPYR